MAQATRTIYTLKCAQVDPKQLLNFIPYYAKRVFAENSKGWISHPIGSLKVNNPRQAYIGNTVLMIGYNNYYQIADQNYQLLLMKSIREIEATMKRY